MHARHGQGWRGDGEGQDRRIGGIHLAVHRRQRQVGGQQVGGGVDGGLDFLLGDVEGESETKAQGDDRSAARTGGGHLRQTRHLAELALQGGGDRGGHHFRAGPRIQGHDLDGGVVHFRQRREGQQPIGQNAGQEDGHHEERGGDGPQDENARRIHEGYPGRLVGGGGLASFRTARAFSLATFGVAGFAPAAFGGRFAVAPALAAHPLLLFAGGSDRRPGFRGDDFDFCPVAQFVGAVGDNAGAGSELAIDGDQIAIGRPRCDGNRTHHPFAIDGVNKGTLGAAQDGRSRNDKSLLAGAEQQADIDKLVGEKSVVIVGKLGFGLDRAGGGIDQIVDGDELAGGEAIFQFPVPAVHRDRFTGRQALVHRRQEALGNGKNDGNWLQLGDDGQTVGVSGAYLVAGVHLAQADAAADRGDDVGVSQLQPGVFDLSSVRLDRSANLPYQGLLRIQLLFGDGVLGPEILVAFEIDFGVFQEGGVLGQLPVGLHQLHLERAGVNVGQGLPPFDLLSFAEMKFNQFTIYPAAHGYLVAGRGCTQGSNPDRHVGLPDLRHRNRLRAASSHTALGRTAGGRFRRLLATVIEGSGKPGDQQQRNNNDVAPLADQSTLPLFFRLRHVHYPIAIAPGARFCELWSRMQLSGGHGDYRQGKAKKDVTGCVELPSWREIARATGRKTLFCIALSGHACPDCKMRYTVQMNSTRRIAHLDMDAFFASVELLSYPHLRGQAVVVGGRSVPPARLADGRWQFARLRDYAGRGVVTTSTYEARALGVFSGMGLMKSAQLAPDAILLPANFDAYRHYSCRFKAAVAAIVPQVEDRGIDEIYLDLTGIGESSESLARRLQNAVQVATGLSCSIGIAPNKLLAKICSDLKKPNGLTVMEAEEIAARIWPLPAIKINGIGPKAGDRLKSLGINTIGELAACPLDQLVANFGHSTGNWMHRAAHGLDDRPVETESEPKSASRETTFERDLHVQHDRAELSQVFTSLCLRVADDLKRKGYAARTVGIKLRYANFQGVTRDITLPTATTDGVAIRRAAGECLKRVPLHQKIRLLGVRASGLVPRSDVQSGQKGGQGVFQFVLETIG